MTNSGVVAGVHGDPFGAVRWTLNIFMYFNEINILD